MLPRRGCWIVLLALLLPSGEAASATVTGVVVDPQGNPVPDAVVRLDSTGATAVTGADGAFALPAPEGADVLSVAAAGATQAAYHVPQGATTLGVVTYDAQDAPPERTVSKHASLVIQNAVGAVNTAEGPGTSADYPFYVESSAADVQVVVSWTPTRNAGGDVQMYVKPKREAGPSNETLLYNGPSPIKFYLPRHLFPAPGKPDDPWNLHIYPKNTAQLDVRLNVTLITTYGPREARDVVGAPPQVKDLQGDAQAALDILDVSVRNESHQAFEIVIGMAHVGAVSPQSMVFAHWTATWRLDGVRYHVRMTAEPTLVPNQMPKPKFSMGVCDETACKPWEEIVGIVVWGSPGAIRFIVPKELVGSPADGMRLEDLTGLTYESVESSGAIPTQASAGFADGTDHGESYELGFPRYRIPDDVVRGALASHQAAMRATPESRAQAFIGVASSPAFSYAALLAGIAAFAVAAQVRARTRHRPAAPRYEVVGELGHGTGGRVRLARDRSLGRLVAIKEPEATDPESAERLRREARALARVSHPNVVQILDIEERGGAGVAIVMEHVPGGSLDARLRPDEPMPVPEALGVWRDVLRGLAEAHAQGIVHRDVKPGNVLLGARGEAKLADFGIARCAAEQTLVGQGTPFGTPAYMAPEQIRGEEPTPRSDLYAAAALAYRMLSGRHIADMRGCRTAWDVLAARQRAAPELPLPQAPAWANDLLRRSLAWDPEERPASALDALAEIEAAEAVSRAQPAA